MKDYSDLGLTGGLCKVGSLADRSEKKFNDAYGFSTNSDRGLIGNYQVRTLSFGKLYGGTCILGGTENGNGLLSVKRADGSEVVRADNTGITISYGSISIFNDSGSSVIDSKGLVSSTNFVNSGAAVSSGVGQTLSGTTYTTLTDGNTPASLSLVLDRSALVLVLAKITFMNTHTDATDWNGSTYFAIHIGTTVKSVFREDHYQDGYEDASQHEDGHASIYNTGQLYHVESLTAGTHTVSLNGKIATVGPDAGSPAVTVDSYALNYIIFGS